MKPLVIALMLLSSGAAYAQQPPPQAALDLGAIQILFGHLNTSINNLLQENVALRAKVKELEAKKDDNKP